jgi:hypothetical protein
VNIELLRDRQRLTKTVTLTERPPS